jgi:hypothetical protein
LFAHGDGAIETSNKVQILSFFSIIDLLKSPNHGNTFNASIPLSNGTIKRFEVVRTLESLPTCLHSTSEKGKAKSYFKRFT